MVAGDDWTDVDWLTELGVTAGDGVVPDNDDGDTVAVVEVERMDRVEEEGEDEGEEEEERVEGDNRLLGASVTGGKAPVNTHQTDILSFYQI